MKLRMGIAVLLLGVGLVGYMAFGTERTNAPPSQENARPSTVEKVEASRGLPVQESATLTEGREVTEQEAPEIYQAFREHLAGGERPAPSPREPLMRSVETTSGTLAILERGDGAVRLLAVALNHDNPDLNNADQGIAFSATITKDGVKISSVDTDRLARFVGTEQTGIANTDEGGASATQPDPVGVSVAMDCKATATEICCVVATEKVFCSCCVSNGTPKCQCVPLAA
jgi:hypothetical protein